MLSSMIILFDVMSTLVRDPFYEDLPRFLDMTFEELLGAKHPTVWMEFERGEIDEATFLARFFADGRTFDGAGMAACMHEGYRWLPGMEALCGELLDGEHALHLVSNYPIWYRHVEERCRLTRYAQWTFVSCEWRLRKPDSRVYDGVLERLDADASECLFVDDGAANVDAAQDKGIDSILFVGVDALRSSLENRGVLT